MILLRKSIVFICVLSLFLLIAFIGNQEPITAVQVDAKKATEENSGEKELVWLVYDRLLQENGDIYKKFNELLVEKGADYTVKFVGFDPMDIEINQNKLLSMKENGRQLDLFMTGFGTEEITTNTWSVENDLLEPLDGYLQSEQGRKLYDQFDEKIWDRVKINETIYGLNNNSEMYYPTAIYINEEVAESLGVEVPKEIHGLDQLEELLKQVNIKNDGKIIPFAYAGSDLRHLTGYDFFGNGIAANYNTDGIPYVLNPFEDPDVVALLESFERLEKENYWKNEQAVQRGQFLSYITTLDPLTYVDGTLYHFDEPIKAKAFPLGDDFIVPLMSDVTGIASWSENKEEAFDLLTRINTDPDLSNLLSYGIEENHYTLEDGAVKYLKDRAQIPGYFSPANRLLTHPEKHEPKDKEKVMKDWLAKAEKSPIMGFELDSTKIEERLREIETIYENYYDLWLVKGIDLDEQLKEVNQQLAEAGIEHVLEEINGQLLKWWEEK